MRKQLMLLTALLLISCPIFAQDESTEQSSSGDLANGREQSKLLIEFAANPFSANGGPSAPILDIGDVGLRVRYNLTDVLAPRLTIRMDMYNEQPNPITVINSSSYDIRPGIEYRFTRDYNFVAYAAADVALLQQFSSYKTSTGTTILGATGLSDLSDPTVAFASNKAFFAIGGALAGGAEYHFKKSRFYIGVEIGLEYLHFMYTDIYLDGRLVQDKTFGNTAGLNLSNSIRLSFKLF